MITIVDHQHDLLTTGEAASILGSNRPHVGNLVKRGDITSTLIGKHYRVRRSDVDMLSIADTRGRTTVRTCNHRASVGYVGTPIPWTTQAEADVIPSSGIGPSLIIIVGCVPSELLSLVVRPHHFGNVPLPATPLERYLRDTH